MRIKLRYWLGGIVLLLLVGVGTILIPAIHLARVRAHRLSDQ